MGRVSCLGTVPSATPMVTTKPSISITTVVLVIVVLAILLLLLGAFAYRTLFKLSWTDAFYAASVTMAGLSLEVRPTRNDQKVFVAIFTLLSVALYLILVAALIACLLQPFLNVAVNNGTHHRIL